MLEIFRTKIDSLSLNEVLIKIKEFLTDGKQHLIVTINPEILLKVRADKNYQDIIKSADLRVVDGFGIILMSYLLGRPLKKGRITGVELTQVLVKEFNNPLFLIGSDSDILQKTTHNLSIKYGKNNIIGYEIGPFFSNDSEFPLHNSINEKLINIINQLKPDILLVGFGAPKQEKWISYYLSKLPSVKLAIGVGGTFDYLSSSILRAPKFFRKIGLEWLWRLIRQPKRLFRIIRAVIVFPILVIIDRFKKVSPQ